ncbi:unnamed protein product, partial [Urochloa humidicola]
PPPHPPPPRVLPPSPRPPGPAQPPSPPPVLAAATMPVGPRYGCASVWAAGPGHKEEDEGRPPPSGALVRESRRRRIHLLPHHQTSRRLPASPPIPNPKPPPHPMVWGLPPPGKAIGLTLRRWRDLIVVFAEASAAVGKVTTASTDRVGVSDVFWPSAGDSQTLIVFSEAW